MKMPYIDEYISKFKELCCTSTYMTRNVEVTYMYLRGLPKILLEDMLKAPQAADYPATKEWAIQATQIISTKNLSYFYLFPSYP